MSIEEKPVRLNTLLEETYPIVDDMFVVFENVRAMFRVWDRSKHVEFIQEVMRLQALEAQLCRLGYSEEFVKLLVKCIYESVFNRYERVKYSSN